MSNDDTSPHVNALASQLVATIWAAAADVAGSPTDKPQERLCAAVRQRLIKSHPTIIGTTISKRSNANRRAWQPSRPKLCSAIAKLVASGNDWVIVPAEKRCVCAFPNKLFARDIAKTVKESSVSEGFTDRSLQFAASEVMAVIVADAKAVGGGRFELHSATDAAWQGSDARGAGIASDDFSKHKLYAAAERIATRITQPEMTMAPFG